MKFLNYLLLERNIINPEYIKWYISGLFHAYQGRARQDIIKWINSNLKNYLLREHPDLRRVTTLSNTGIKIEPWMEAAFKKGDLYGLVISDNFRQQILHTLDYFIANPDLNVSRISIPEAIRQGEEWTERQNKKASDLEDATGIQEVRKYSDGFRWIKVISQQSLDREGKLMRHCVGSYCDQVSSGSTNIYSLRDKKNEPHCTIEVKYRDIQQIKGKANREVDKKYVKYVKDFVIKPIEGKNYRQVNDLDNIGLVKLGDNYRDIDKLTESDKKDIIDHLIRILMRIEKIWVNNYMLWWATDFVNQVQRDDSFIHYTEEGIMDNLRKVGFIDDIEKKAYKLSIKNLIEIYKTSLELVHYGLVDN